MKKSLFSFIIISCTLFFFSSCTEENITNYYDAEKGGGVLDVNIIMSSYTLETFDSFHIDTATNGQIQALNLDLILDKPENRSQINKMIIINEQGYGWEFTRQELMSLFVDSLNGFRFNRLTLSGYTNNFNYTVKLFSSNNSTGNDFKFLIRYVNFNSEAGTGAWSSSQKFTIPVYGMWDMVRNFKGKIQWLNSSKQNNGESLFSLSDIVSGKLPVYNIPEDAFYYYFDISGIINDIKYSAKSELYKLPDRLPSNTQIIENSGNRPDIIMLIDSNSKILVRKESNFYIYDYTTMEVLKTFQSYNGSGYLYSEKNKKIFFQVSDGIYSYGIDDNQPKQEYLSANAINDFTAADNYLIVNTGGKIEIINLLNNNKRVIKESFYTSDIKFNIKKNIIYGIADNYIYRCNFNPSNGDLSGDTVMMRNNNLGSNCSITPDGEYLIGSNGKVYRCSEDQNMDLSSEKSIDSFIYARFTSNSDLITLVRNPNTNSVALNIYSGIYELKTKMLHFYNEPFSFLVSGMSIKVFSADPNYSSKVTVEEFNYNDLVNSRPVVEKTIKKYYPMKKINY